MDVVIKSLIAFAVLLLLTRLLGKKQMNQITYFDYIAGITLGSIAADISVEPAVQVLPGIYSLLVWSTLTFLLSFITQKSYAAGNFFDGQPDIIIKNVKIIKDKIKKAHLNMDDITMLLREKDVFSIKDVDYAILEPHDKLSVLKKSEQSAATKKDLGITDCCGKKSHRTLSYPYNNPGCGRRPRTILL